MLLNRYSKPKNIECTFCHYKTNRPFNLDRHMVIKHLQQKKKNTSTKETLASTKETLDSTKIILPNQCDICEKIFAKHCTMIYHKEKCKGKINPFQCIYCNEIFTYSTHKYRHQKICKEKIPSTDLCIPENEANSIIGTNINIGTNICTNIGNIENQNNNTSNINNTQNINIVIYSNDTTEKFLNDSHIDNNTIAKIINDQSMLDTLNNYNRELFSIKENQCIRKTNLRSSDSKIHIGNNKWETRKDSEIFPKLMCSSANSFSEILTLKRLSRRYPELDKVLHYVGEEGYINTDDKIKEKEINDLFKDSVRSFTRIIYDLTNENNITI